MVDGGTGQVAEDRAPGWEAIDKALKPIYGDQEPLHFGTMIKYMLGGPDPIDGISIYKSNKGTPHLHYVTYGFTELYDKESENKDYSGYGFELTMRLKHEGNSEPPQWPISMMQNLARYVFSSGNVFAAGHYLDCNGPIALDSDTQLVAVVFVEDPELPPMETPHGKVSFLQIVGVTADEFRVAKLWKTTKFAELIAESNPLLITDLERTSLLTDSSVQKRVDEGIAADGSHTGSLFVTQLDYKRGLLGKSSLIIGAHGVNDLVALLPARLRHDRDLTLYGEQRAVRLAPAETFSIDQTDELITINLTKDDVSAFVQNVKMNAGEYKVRHGFNIMVVKTEIKDHEGKVVKVIG